MLKYLITYDLQRATNTFVVEASCLQEAKDAAYEAVLEAFDNCESHSAQLLTKELAAVYGLEDQIDEKAA